jgi:hypothetical protein
MCNQTWPCFYYFLNSHVFFIVVLGGGTLWNLQKFLQYIILEFTPSNILPYPPLPLFLVVSTGVIFHLHTCVHIICTIFPLPHSFLTSSPSSWYQSPQTLSSYFIHFAVYLIQSSTLFPTAVLFMLLFLKNQNPCMWALESVHIHKLNQFQAHAEQCEYHCN